MSPTEASSLKLNADGKITKFSTGYVVDRSGNTGGLGALFGIMRKLLQLAWARGSPSSEVFSTHVSLEGVMESFLVIVCFFLSMGTPRLCCPQLLHCLTNSIWHLMRFLELY